ncbi:MAG TPA: substrate-binding domain-containing protein [Acidobacteriota bacterium]|nr:substrate-binding domain-containing protein [Acidobacteriota bacterium]
MLTTKEVAEYLSINEKQVYRLIKEKKIPATRITGKWLFPKNLIDEWVMASARESVSISTPRSAPENQVVIAGSNDLALELLAKNTTVRHPRYTISISNVGSLAGLIALQKGNCHIAASHLLDLETGEYNSSFIKKHFPNLKIVLLNLAHREQGLIVKKGNPLGIKTIKNLANQALTFVNRQEGSGTRVLLDYRLKELEIDPADIPGYSKIALTHMDVALEVFSSTADVGIGILAAARMLDLDFIPLATERFDLVIPTENYSTGAVKALREVLCSEDFKSHIRNMGGYETRDTGKIVYERA